ncbi:taste receptor type 2 member 13-like [Loxodonta africana]|nr:taste receptor type 2 member 13-like [Loxodonta africana]
MESAVQIALTIIIVAGFIIGSLGNGFIVLTNCIDWTNRRKLSLVDQILTGLALSRIGLLWEILVNWFGSLYYSALLMRGPGLRMIAFAWIITNHFSIWLATILSIFYLLRIANFSSPFFLYLKWRVKKLILMILLGSLVFLFLNLIHINVYINDWMHVYEGNTTWNSRTRDSATFSGPTILTVTMFTLIPFTVALVSFLLLIFSLWKHLNRMQLHSKRPRDSRTKAHINALKTVISFLLLYSTFFLALLIASLSHTLQNKLYLMFGQAIGTVYPSSHSFILILGNSKLRQASLCCCGCRGGADR